VAIPRLRLDELVLRKGLAPTRSSARALIMAGLVTVDGELSDKAGRQVTEDACVAVAKRPRYVSRGGDKLANALEAFSVDPQGACALDVGASTGGFVDCLLQAGAARVVGVDVGRGQLDMRLRADARVTVLEKVNARYLTADMLPFVPDLLTMDVSFISVAKVLPAVMSCMAPICTGVILIKPQFEAGREQVGKGGIVRGAAVHRDVLMRLGTFVIEDLGVELRGVTDSGLPGADGNVEFFFHIGCGGENGYGIDTLENVVGETVARVSTLTGSG
jgi:23S rRNA (cytidine1920-2'-O)/16S rRNA (cytidine1409-2'-O)-methyltransferase